MCFAKCSVLQFGGQARPISPLAGQPLSRQWGLPGNASTSHSRAVAPGGLAASCAAATLALKGLAQTPPTLLQNVLTTQEDLGGTRQRSPPCDSCIEAFLQLPWHGQALSPHLQDRPAVDKHPNWLHVHSSRTFQLDAIQPWQCCCEGHAT